jgi:xanthine dehydrogenase accessory factor
VTVDVLGLARERARHEPCVLATVVWRRAPSSGREGGKALIGADGSVQGWLGGACAEPAVVREALRALEEGTPRLMFLGPPDELEERRRDGMVSVPIACQSEGALEVYLEPMLPPPHLVAVGRSPAVDALAQMAAALGWRAVVVDDGGAPENHPGASEVVTTLDLAAAGASGHSMVVVATQGHYDEEALEQALAAGAAYVGLVASRKRAESVLGYLRQRGVPADDLARVRAPAGLDLGHVAPDEIAVAILAELVQLRAAGELRASQAPASAPASAEATDPICGMTVDIATARHVLEREDETVYFCCAGCMAAYEADPSRAGAG